MMIIGGSRSFCWQHPRRARAKSAWVRNVGPARAPSWSLDGRAVTADPAMQGPKEPVRPRAPRPCGLQRAELAVNVGGRRHLPLALSTHLPRLQRRSRDRAFDGLNRRRRAIDPLLSCGGVCRGAHTERDPDRWELRARLRSVVSLLLREERWPASTVNCHRAQRACRPRAVAINGLQRRGRAL